MTAEAEGFTVLMAQHRAGDPSAHGRLIALVYADLRRLAQRHLGGNRWIGTLNATSMIHESYLRLIAPAAQHVQTRDHFMNLASRVMRQIVCDYARRRLREAEHFERGVATEEVDARADAELAQARQLVILEEALNDLSEINERQARVIECRYFSGLSEEETASALGVSLRTVQRDWNDAKRWLADNMHER